MSYQRLEAMGGIQWPCYDESHPGELYLHGRLWNEPLIGPRRAPFSPVEFEPALDVLDENYPIRLTTGRRLDSYNTNVQSGRYAFAAAPSRDPGYFSGRTARITTCTKEKKVKVSSRPGIGDCSGALRYRG